MKINYMKNPLAIVKRFDILYDNKQRHLEGRIIAHVEEGSDEVNWFSGEVRYSENYEIGGVQKDKRYQDLRKGASTQEEVEKKMKKWCKSYGLKISTGTEETKGVTR
jgi:coproporphyrinogen III oxidase